MSGWVHVSCGPTVVWNVSRIPLITWLPCAPTLIWGSWCSLRVLGININSTLCPKVLKTSVSPLFPVSVQFSHSVVWPHGLQCARLPCPSPTPRACSNSCPSSQWCQLIISSSVNPFSCLQSFPASGSFPRSQLFSSGGQSIGASALASVPPVNIQDWFHLWLTGLISLQSKGFSRVFSNTTVQKHKLSSFL